MAKKGLKHFVCGKYVSTGVYEEGRVLGAIECAINTENNDVKLYVDDNVKETDTSFKGGTVEPTTDDLTDEDYAFLLGHTIDEESGDVIASTADEAPVVGWGFYGAVSRNNIISYRAVFLLKTKFSEPTDENTTKGDSTEFKTKKLTGPIMMEEDGTWKREHTFETEKEAVAWLDGMANVKETLGLLNVTSTEGTTTGKTKITVTPTKEETNKYYYKSGVSVALPNYDESVSSWTAWEETEEITATNGEKIAVVEADTTGKAKKGGTATVKSKVGA